MVGVILVFTGGFALSDIRSERNQYWKIQCEVTACEPSQPHIDTISIRAMERYDRTVLLQVKDVCCKYPVGSHVTCYINEHKLLLTLPSMASSLAQAISAAVLVLAAAIINCLRRAAEPIAYCCGCVIAERTIEAIPDFRVADESYPPSPVVPTNYTSSVAVPVTIAPRVAVNPLPTLRAPPLPTATSESDNVSRERVEMM